MTSDTPPAIVQPAPTEAAFQRDFDATASAGVRAWVATEASALLAAPLDLPRLRRDAAMRASASPEPEETALVLRYAVELRLARSLRERVGARPAVTADPSARGGDGMSSNAVGPSQSKGQLSSATHAMQETQTSFDPRYLQLQQEMQNDAREFTVESNIMKTKHDTVKNTISNIR